MGNPPFPGDTYSGGATWVLYVTKADLGGTFNHRIQRVQRACVQLCSWRSDGAERTVAGHRLLESGWEEAQVGSVEGREFAVRNMGWRE